MVTEKQKAYIMNLMSALNHANPKYGPTSGSKSYTTCRERSGGWSVFFDGMTSKRASELINKLKNW